MHGKNDKRRVIVSVDQVRPGLFCVHCEWTERPTSIKLPSTSPFGDRSVSGNKSVVFKNPSQFGNNYGSSLTNKSTSSNQTLVSSDLRPTSFDEPSLDLSFEEARLQQLQLFSLSGPPTAIPASFNFGKPTQTTTSSVFHFGKEWNMSQQQKTFGFGDNPQANSFVSSSGANTNQPSRVHNSSFLPPTVNTSLGTSNNTYEANARKEMVEYVAEFTINQQSYTFKTSFTTSTSNVMGSFALTQMRTQPRLFAEVDKISDEPIGDNGMVEKDNVQLPVAVWVNADESKKKYHLLKFSNSDNRWVSDNFNTSFACFTNSSVGSFIAWKLLACSVWIEFETSSVGERNTLKHLTDLYVKQIYCDVQFSFKGDQHIGGHRNILAASSTVFAAMFQHNMKEAITGQVNIEDSEPDIFKQLLHYIYSGRILTPLTDAIAQPLFLVADKYNIQDLKKECATFLLTCVRMDNVIGLLVWAHLHSVDALKEVTLTSVTHNAKDICRLKDWEELTKNYPDLCVLATRRIMGCASQ